MTTPRDISPAPAEETSGVSRVSAAVRQGMTLWQRAQRTRPVRAFSHFTNVGGSVLSGGMSYQALFAVFAGLWLGFGIFGIVLSGRPELVDTLVENLNTFVPGLVGPGQGYAVDISMLLQGRTFNWGSIVAGAALVWVALNWFTGTRRSIRIIFGLEVKEYRNALLLKLRDLALAVGFFAAILVSAVLTVLSSGIADWLLSVIGANGDGWFFGWLGTVVRYGAMFVFDVLVLVAMHRLLAEVRVPRWSLLAGCALGGVALLGLKILGSAALGGATSNPLLATFAVFVGLLLWFNFICRALLLTSCWIATGQDRALGLPETPAPHAA
ncbi:YihY/virulence factor BrkB family protein [Leucobacter chromiireducens]|uniref:YihY/virulence factor BrkB family protein n=1 Tax=Leucobacter chromiireducens TaxID=283877 RepID=UPI000F643A8C|nr:YihY/virulence factor BrkB family protein [Leucobacter chromiireducens]